MRDTSRTGEICRQQVMAVLTLQGKLLLTPVGDYHRYDFAIDEGDKFYRVQCKNGKLSNGTLTFDPCSVDSRSEPGRCIRKRYDGEVDLFGVYCPDNNRCYLVPAEHATGYRCFLRIDPPRNGQKTRIRWASQFEIGSGVTSALPIPNDKRAAPE